MAMATCWNCGARVSGSTCQMCGAAQQQGGMQGQPAYGPGGQQPVVSQASMSVRPPPTANPYAPGGQYPPPTANPYAPGGQYPPPAGQPGGWQGYQQPGYQGPSAYQQQQAASGTRSGIPGAQQSSLSEVLPMAFLGGIIAAVVGAIGWAFIGHYSNRVFGFLLGIVVGLGVWLGARGYRHIALAGLAAVLGLFSLVLGIYFLGSLDVASALGEGVNLFALPIDIFFTDLGDFFKDNPFLYVYLVVVPLLAAVSTFRGRSSR